MAYVSNAILRTDRPVRPPAPQIKRRILAAFRTDRSVPPPAVQIKRRLPAMRGFSRVKALNAGLSGFADDLGNVFNTAIQGFTTYKMADLQFKQADAQARLARAQAEAEMQAAIAARQRASAVATKVSGAMSSTVAPLLIGGVALGGWMLFRRKGR